MLLKSAVTGLLIGMMAATATAQDAGVGTSNPNPQDSSGYWTKQRMKSAQPIYQTPGKGFVPRKQPHAQPPPATTGGGGSEGTGSSTRLR
jgi:hypothetical protein